MAKGRPRGAKEARVKAVGKYWTIRLYCTARIDKDGRFVPVNQHGKASVGPDGKNIRRHFMFNLGETSKLPAKGAALALAVAKVKAEIEAADKSIIENETSLERPDDMPVA